MKTIGKYHDLALFFDRIAKLPRIVNILDITISRKSAGKTEKYIGNLDASFKAVTYKFIDVKQDSDKKKQGKDKKKK
jgi:type IV pilus assembly protein PilO